MPRTSRSNRLAVAAVALAPVVGTLLMAGCGGDDDSGDTARFCADVEANRDALFDASLATADDVAGFVALYRQVGENAPLAIEAHWKALTAVFETAEMFEPDSTVVTEQDVLGQSYSSEQSALAVRDWLAENCRITIAVATVPPPVLQVTAPVPSGSVPSAPVVSSTG